MKIIGITGPSGAGKGVCSDFCRQLSFPVFDADATYHSVILPPSPCLNELQKTFGREIINTDGTLNRKELAEIVFNDPTHVLQQKLNSITHHYVLDVIRNNIRIQREVGAAAVFIDAPLLIESGFNKECDAVIAVLADRSVRLDRIMQRDGISKDAAQKRIDAQPCDDFYVAASDYVIYNDKSLQDVREELTNVFLKMGIIS